MINYIVVDIAGGVWSQLGPGSFYLVLYFFRVNGLWEVPTAHSTQTIWVWKVFSLLQTIGNILLYIISTNGFEGALLKRTMDSVCNIGFLSLLLSSWFLSALHQCASQTSYWAKAISGKLAKPHKTRENYFRSQKCIQNIGTICNLHKIWFKDGYFWKLFRLMEFLKKGLFHWNLLILNGTLHTACV